MRATICSHGSVSAWPCTATRRRPSFSTGSPTDMRARPLSMGPTENLKVKASPGSAPECAAAAGAASIVTSANRRVKRGVWYSEPVRIGVTLGDPAGIGPELVAAALALDPSGLVVFGDRDILFAA